MISIHTCDIHHEARLNIEGKFIRHVFWEFSMLQFSLADFTHYL